MPCLLLWSDAYFFGGIAQFLLVATLLIAGLALLTSWLSGSKNEFLEPEAAAGQPAKAGKESGCTVFLLLATGFFFFLFALAKLLAS